MTQSRMTQKDPKFSRTWFSGEEALASTTSGECRGPGAGVSAGNWTCGLLSHPAVKLVSLRDNKAQQSQQTLQDKLWGPLTELTSYQLKYFLHLCIVKPTVDALSARMQPKVKGRPRKRRLKMVK